LVGRNKSLTIKKQILLQKGGAFLPLLLSTVLGGLSSIFIKLLKMEHSTKMTLVPTTGA
jgi:hypothetical protein